MFCVQCGTAIATNARFCGECGAPTQAESNYGALQHKQNTVPQQAASQQWTGEQLRGAEMKAIFRDAITIFVLTFVFGLAIGAVLGAQEISGDMGMAVVAISNIAILIVGFCISGAIAKHNRFRHLFKVAIVIWLLGSINIALIDMKFVEWAVSLILVLMTMGVGGLISYLFSSNSAPVANQSEKS